MLPCQGAIYYEFMHGVFKVQLLEVQPFISLHYTSEEFCSYNELTTHSWEMEWNCRESTPQQTKIGTRSRQARWENQWLLTRLPFRGQIHRLAYLSDPACLSHTCKLLSSLLYSWNVFFKLKESLPKVSNLHDIWACTASEHSHLRPRETEPTSCIQYGNAYFLFFKAPIQK